MEITEVKVFPIQEEKLKAFVSIVFDQCFMVNDIKIIQGRDGLFISMPSRKKKNGEFKDVAHPLNNETRRMIEDQILAEYARVLGERGEHLPAPPAAARNDGAARAAASDSNAGNSANPANPANPSDIAAAPVAHPAWPATPAASAVPAAGGDPAGWMGHPGHPNQPGDAGQPGRAAHPGNPGNPANTAAEPAVPGAQPPTEKTLEEIEEMHLRDSFWTVT